MGGPRASVPSSCLACLPRPIPSIIPLPSPLPQLIEASQAGEPMLRLTALITSVSAYTPVGRHVANQQVEHLTAILDRTANAGSLTR
jgi:hypothetical protein